MPSSDSKHHKLYYSMICPFAQRAMIVAKHKECPHVNAPTTFEYIHLDLSGSLPEWYIKEVNPREEVPALVLPNGPKLTESMPIALYLDDALEPRCSLFSTDAEVRRRIRQLVSDFEPAMGCLYSALSCKPEETELKVDAVRRELRRFVPLLSNSSDYAFGSAFSMADVLICPFIIRFSYLCPIFCGFDLMGEFPRLRAFRDQCLAIPAVSLTSPSAEFCIAGYGISYAKDKPAVWQYRLKVGVDCPYSERVELVWAYITAEGTPGPSYIKGKQKAYMAVKTVEDLRTEANVPALTLPSGAAITGSVEAATYFAEQFLECGLLPEAAADTYAGRWYAHTCEMVISDIIGSILAKTKYFEVADPVVFELQRAEKVFADAPYIFFADEEKKTKRPAKAFMFGDRPSLFDLLVIPFFHRAEILLGPKLAEIAPSIAGSVKAARECPVLGPKLITGGEYFTSSTRN